MKIDHQALRALTVRMLRAGGSAEGEAVAVADHLVEANLAGHDSHSLFDAIGDALESGMVGVNSVAISTPETPFGGVKDSGYGHEGGIEGMEAYMVRKFISQA